MVSASVNSLRKTQMLESSLRKHTAKFHKEKILRKNTTISKCKNIYHASTLIFSITYNRTLREAITPKLHERINLSEKTFLRKNNIICQTVVSKKKVSYPMTLLVFIQTTQVI